MRLLHTYASAITIAAAMSAVAPAYADCAADLATLRGELNMTASTSDGMAQAPAGSAAPAADSQISPAGMPEQDAASATAGMSADGAGTASVGSTASSAGAAGDTAANGTAASTNMAGETPEFTPESKDQAAAATGGETFTQSSNPSTSTGAAGSAATGAVSGVAPTAALGQVAEGSTPSGTTEAGGNGAAAATASGETAATGAPAGDASQRVMTHLSDAEAAMARGDEAACAKAIEDAKGAL